MSAAPTDPDPFIQQLLDEGYELEILHQHLLVHGIPYVNAQGEVCSGILAVPYTGTRQDGVAARPVDHTMWFQGELPHHRASGKPMSNVVNNSNAKNLFEGFTGNHYFSNKPNNTVPNNFYELVTHYHSLLRAEAQLIDPNADGRTGKARPNRDPDSVFLYPDTASCRAGITGLSQRLKDYRVAIIGVGGTGSYILDLMAKTAVKEIHSFDGDTFDSHNAFRSPGVATLDEVNRSENKAVFFQERYQQFRKGIVSRPYRVSADNLSELDDFDFIFVCIDCGTSRKLICEYLSKKGKGFIDTGIGMKLHTFDSVPEELSGTCRVTACTQEKNDHLDRCLDYSPDDDNLYDSNIQVADMNALNAAMAVIRWKQIVGIYQDQGRAHNLKLATSLQSLHREEFQEILWAE
ncbi:MAG: ThiF family adenylyltransferase [Gammaproteobacteria bacterium]|nr:MAG: ThiF family adenylyltransferase [Gammaproteobacteria bacterium]